MQHSVTEMGRADGDWSAWCTRVETRTTRDAPWRYCTYGRAEGNVPGRPIECAARSLGLSVAIVVRDVRMGRSVPSAAGAQ